MNQYGFVEITVVRNEKPFRALLPLGASWHEALEALNEMTAAITDHIKKTEEAQAAADAEKSAQPEA